jgi:hypothetical protein
MRNFFTGAENFPNEPMRRMEAMHNHLSDSANQAQAILGAWNSGNVQLFCKELDRVNTSAASAADQAEEIERMELLCAIADDLRINSLQPPADDPSNVYGKLLRHLAFSQRTAGGLTEFIQ